MDNRLNPRAGEPAHWNKSLNYLAYGLEIISNISLPFLTVADCKISRAYREGIPRISITLHENCSEYVAPEDGLGAQWSINRDSAELIIKDLAKFQVQNGRVIDIHPAFPLDIRMIRLLLINSVLAFLLFQRKMLVLHGSCVELGDGAVVFMGDSGAGKSLLAGTLCSRGHRLITDDITSIDMDQQTLNVLPGYPMIKMLPRDSAMLGFADSQRVPLHDRNDKCGCLLGDSFTLNKGVSLRYIFVLSIGAKRVIEELSAREAFVHLLGNSAPQIWQVAPDELHFSHLEKLCQNVVVCRFTREENVQALPQHIEIIKKYCHTSQ